MRANGCRRSLLFLRSQRFMNSRGLHFSARLILIAVILSQFTDDDNGHGQIGSNNERFGRSESITNERSSTMRGVRQGDPGSLSAEGARHALARGLLEVRLLRLSARRGGLHTLHEGKFNAVQKGLPEVSQSVRLASQAALYGAQPARRFPLLSLG